MFIELAEVDLFGDHERPVGVVVDLSDWSMEEELYVGHHHECPRQAGQKNSLRYVFGGLAKLGLFVGILLALKSFLE